jgi:hypothetical protein
MRPKNHNVVVVRIRVTPHTGDSHPVKVSRDQLSNDLAEDVPVGTTALNLALLGDRKDRNQKVVFRYL